MKITIATEQDLIDHTEPLPEGMVMIYFKMVGIGPNTLANANFVGKEVCKLAREQSGFFLFNENSEGLRTAMHDLVNRFCDAQEGKYEPKN